MTDPNEIQASRRTRRRMTLLLLVWSIASIVLAPTIYWIAATQESASRKFAEALALQFLIWGLIDLVFAAVGVISSRRSETSPGAVPDFTAEQRGVEKLLNALRFNVKLNWFWVASGAVLLAAGVGAGWRGSSAESVGSLFGHGAGVLCQAGFLFWFDRSFLHKLQPAGPAGA
ncbi:MAG TPA: hypothetical protein PLD59_01475 [Tepidisphaeraceae bacterium]|nr:hypothetical protein [Tepidisphaeraceae bacterium]